MATMTDGQPIGMAVRVEERGDRVGGDRHRELGVAGCLEPQRADDPMLTAGAGDLGLVDVMQERGSLDERAVDWDLRLGDEAGGGHRDPGHPTRVDHDALGKLGLVEQAKGGGAVRNGHGPMLPVSVAACTGTEPCQPASVRTWKVAPSVAISTSPSRSVRKTAHVREGGERLRRGVPVLVVDPGGDDRDAGTNGLEELGGRRRVRAVVPDLEQVDRPERATRDQRRLDRCLRVAGEERPERAVADLEHHRSVVDVAIGEGRARIGVAGVHDAQRGRRVERDLCARAGEHDGDAGGGRIGQKPFVRRIVEGDAGVHDGADPKAVEDLDQAGDVVLVRVAQDEQVDPARPRRAGWSRCAAG